MKLIVGNKNYSSWSLRAWLLLTELDLPFEEQALSFNDPTFDEKLGRYAPAQTVPLLIDDDGTIVWDSIAITEHVAERFPDRGVWPSEPQARALARSMCAEMHASFQTLRAALPMNLTARLPGLGWNVRVQEDIDRITALWHAARSRFGSGGSFLFGRFSAADAYYAPVATRFVTHDIKLPATAAAYVTAITALPSMQRWTQAAAAENDFVLIDEPYRQPPGARPAR